MLNRALFIIIGMSLLTACAQQPDDPQQSYYNPAYDPTSCEEFTPGLGEPADVSNIQVDDIRDSGYFAKPYDYADLEAVLRASPTQTALYGERLGVALNKVPRRASEGGPQPCRLFAFLKLPPPELMYLWQSVAGDGGEGILAGLYFENCPEDECPQDRVQKPTIMIDDSMDRWTLVHEMTHHNFNKERKQRDDFQSNTQLRKIIESEKKAYHTANNLSNAATHLERLTQATYRFLVQTIFEEIAVEGLLLKEFESDRLEYVSESFAQNAVWYIEHSRNEGLARFYWIDAQTTVLISKAQAEDDIVAERKAQQIRDFLNDLALSTQEMLDDAMNRANGLASVRRPVSSLAFASIIKAQSVLNGIDRHVQAQNRELEELDRIFAQ